MTFQKDRLTFKKAYRRAYRGALGDIEKMEDATPVGKYKVILNPATVRARIRAILLKVDGVKEKTAVDWANRIYQRAQNFRKRRREYGIKRNLREKIRKAHPSKTEEQIDAYLELVYAQAMKPTKERSPVPKLAPKHSPEVAAVLVARKAARKKMVENNRHMRSGDQKKKKIE